MRPYDHNDHKQLAESYLLPIEVDAAIVDLSLNDYELFNLGCEAFIGALTVKKIYPCVYLASLADLREPF